MKWTAIFLSFLILMNGCTIRVEPLNEKKAAKHSSKKKAVTKHEQKRPVVSPTPTPLMNQPMQLEPLEKPTPMIKVPPSALANQWTMTSV